MLKIDALTAITTQLVAQLVKTPKQTNYKGASIYNTIETSLNVDVGLYEYHPTRTRELVKFLSDLNPKIVMTRLLI